MIVEWYGHAGHFIGAPTVGDYHPRSRDAREEIGFQRYFETMVFRAGEACTRPDCDCGLPEIDGSEQDFEGYQTAGEAKRGHMRMVEKYAAECEEAAS